VDPFCFFKFSCELQDAFTQTSFTVLNILLAAFWVICLQTVRVSMLLITTLQFILLLCISSYNLLLSLTCITLSRLSKCCLGDKKSIWHVKSLAPNNSEKWILGKPGLNYVLSMYVCMYYCVNTVILLCWQ